jgi:glycosyltransferase involved in cell wall biosynthesis
MPEAARTVEVARPSAEPAHTTSRRVVPETELTVVMPCLNEAETIATCVRKAQRAMRAAAIVGEVLVADNGSTDGSREIAADLGARVIHVEARGYGHALMGGIDAARGRYVIMGDADDSYDFSEIPRLLEKLREGYDLAQACRLPSGGGRVMPGAMPSLHRWVGNPLFSFLVRRMFGAPVRDVYCGMRGFTKAMYERLDLRCAGMEFATEMIIKATLHGERVSEVPITLHPDGRKSRTPHLKTVRDGWRTLRFFLMCSPRWLFLIPGVALILLGAAGYGLAMSNLTIGRVTFDAHTLLFASLFVMLGYQSVLFAILSKTFAVSEGLLPADRRLEQFFRVFNLERGLVVSALSLVAGMLFLLVAVNQWRLAGFGELDYARTMRWVIPGVTLTALGFQTFLFGFLTSILGMRRR